jgi:hypothetical protein
MELHKNIVIDKAKYNFSLNDNYLDYFAKASDFTLTYYKDDFDRIANTKFSEVSAEFFFREYCWCVCTSGFNAKIVSKFFPQLLEALSPLFDMVNGKTDIVNSIDIAMSAMNVFGNRRKIKAMIDTAFILRDGIKKYTWETYRNNELNTPHKLMMFPYIGSITKFHLARNCSMLDFVKPDIHLERAAKYWKFDNSLEMCKAIQTKYDIPLGLIDLVLWYSFSTFGSKK